MSLEFSYGHVILLRKLSQSSGSLQTRIIWVIIEIAPSMRLFLTRQIGSRWPMRTARNWSTLRLLYVSAVIRREVLHCRKSARIWDRFTPYPSAGTYAGFGQIVSNAVRSALLLVLIVLKTLLFHVTFHVTPAHSPRRDCLKLMMILGVRVVMRE